MPRKYFTISLMILILSALTVISSGQTPPPSDLNTNDSLTLHQVLKQVLSSYPSVMKAEEAIRSAEAAVGLARSGYYPNISGQASYTRLGPVSKLSFPGFGTFQVYPENNYDVEVDIRQTIYDFEKTSRNVKLEESGKTLTEKNIELVKQKLTLITAVSYYNLVYLQEALKIKDIQINNLNDHLAFVTEKNETGSATQYEILTTQVRISGAENQKVDILTSIKSQQAILNSLLGFRTGSQIKVKKAPDITGSPTDTDSLIHYALEHRYEMIIAGMREEHALLYLKSVKVQENPELSAFLAGGWKNGFIPHLNELTANYEAGVGLHVPIFDATRRKNYIRLANAEISMLKQETDKTRRDIASEVYQNDASLQASLKKIQLSDLQVSQAEQALELANVSYTSGVITNLDLLDAETAAAESKLNLLKARTDFAINLVRLNLSVGKPVN